jgi:predicted small lipoprotein YifL
MLNRRNWVVSIIALLLVASLAACTAAPVAVPDREIMVDVNTAFEAQNKAMGLMAGSVEWSEAEFSSLLSVLLQQNGGENNPVTDIKVWFEPGNQVFISVGLKDGVIPTGNTLDLAGTVGVDMNHVVVDLQQVGAGNMSISGAALAPISAQINAALADPSLGVAVDVSTDTGMITVGLGGM